MQTSDDTQPRNPLQGQNINRFPDQPTGQMLYPEDEEVGGPGCIIWGIVGMFSVLLAGLLVMISAFAGWNSGLSSARTNATATKNTDIQTQCEFTRTDVENGNMGLLQRRIEDLEKQTPAPPCLAEIIPTATALYMLSLPTETPTPTETATPTITPSPEATELVDDTATPTSLTEDTTSSTVLGYDLDALLSEAETQLANQQYQAAIDTLDAIMAIDETYQRTQIENMMFNAMTSEATRLFRAGDLQQGIILTGRAEAFGDIQGLNYERFIAQLYLDAQRLKITNPAQSVRLFSRVAYEQGLTNYLNGQVMTELQEAYTNYGNILSENGDFCGARDQYTAALQLQPPFTNISRGDVTGKRDSAAAACTGGAVPTGEGTPAQGDSGDGSGAVVTQQAFPTATQQTIAPVGQSG